MDARRADVGGFSKSHRRRIRAAIPDNISPLPAFWLELESIAANYRMLKANRKRRPPAVEIRRWQRIDRLERKASELRGGAPSWARMFQPLAGLCSSIPSGDTQRQIANWRSLNEGFSRKRNLHDVTLHGWILDLWHQGFGQPLTASSYDNNTGTVGGPLVRFFSAVSAPLLDKPLTIKGVVAIVGREGPKAQKRAEITAQTRTLFMNAKNISKVDR